MIHELKKPEWLKARLPSGRKYHQVKSLIHSLGLSTVCEEARCPNMGECWSGGTATLMLMGDVCTRGCRFCHVKTGNPKGKLDEREPEKVARAVSLLNLSYVVLTSVNRDDLPDEGAGHFAETILFVKKQIPSIMVEVLTPDFKGRHHLIDKVLLSQPDVFAHNIETVKRLTPLVRDPRAGYNQSLKALSRAKKHSPSVYTKSSLMLGLGEKEREVFQTLRDLRAVGCDIVTFGQYLRPSRRHLPVKEYIRPEKFKSWKWEAENLGFLYSAGGPLIRSSYRAGEFFLESLIKKRSYKKQRAIKNYEQ